MNNFGRKILITALIALLCLTFVGCNFEGVLYYMTGNFPSAEPSRPSGSTGAPSDGSPVVINKGTATTQSGGLADVVEEVAPSVVEISAIYNYEHIKGTKHSQESRGSGIILKREDGTAYIVTNQHVVADGKHITQYNSIIYRFVDMVITVRLSTGTEHKAVKVFDDKDNDIALLTVSKDEFTEASAFDRVVTAKVQTTYSVSEGERIFAIGNPLGTLGGTVTAGIISAKEREMVVEGNITMKLIQMDAAVNEGNSGGALFNYEGKLVGVVNAKISKTGVEGLGFAIPIVTVLDVLHRAGHLEDINC